jgi:DNA polymerase I
MSTGSSGLSALLGLASEEDRLLLFDGHSIAYRSYYAIRDLSTRDGRPVNAIFGFWRALTRVVRDFPSTHVAVAFDGGGVTFRHELFSDYKATRKEMPADLAEQLPLIQRLLQCLGIPIFSMEGIEADDILASLARTAEREGLPVFITTSDKDLAQLVDDRIRLLRPSRRGKEAVEVFDAGRVVETFGVSPNQMVDYLALVGDSSDNVPGVPSVGPKTAARLLEQFGTLDDLLAHPDEVRNERLRKAIVQHVETARLAKRLVTLDEAVAGTQRLEDCALRKPDRHDLQSLLSELEFRSILDELDLPERAPSAPQRSAVYETVLSPEALAALAERLARAPELSIDLETTSRDPMRAQIVGIALSDAPFAGWYIPVGHRYLGAPAQLSLESVLDALRGLLEGEAPRLIGQNLKYDLTILERYGISPRGVAFDAMIASHLARPDERHHNLETIARAYLGYEMLSYEALAGKNGEMAAVPVDKAAFYAAEDAEIVSRVKPLLEGALTAVGAARLFEEVEVPLVPVLARMERNGILVNRQVLAAQGEELRERLSILREDLYEIAGESFNPGSPKQVAEILFDRLGLPVIDRTKTGPSTSARVLSELAAQHPLPGKLIAYRELEKLLNTYIERLPEAINPETGRIHTSFHQTATATGRLSSSDPNLQNIPTRTEIGERIRRAFVAPEGSALVGADYSQIELRLLAHFSEDEALRSTFAQGKDLHLMTASRVFALPPERVTGRLRNAAKRINFGIIYGISPYGLARELGIPREEAKAYIDRFFAAYPQAKAYMERMVDQARRCGYAETILGRRRLLPDLTSKRPQSRSFAERNAINTPIQGSAADLIKLAMLQIDEAIETGALQARILLQIHDELIFEVPETSVDAAVRQIKDAMEHVMDLGVPLEVTVKHGRNWSEI